MMTSLQQSRSTVFPVRYLLVTGLFFLSAVAYLDRTNISIAGIQIAKEFAIDNAHLGWLISAFLLGYAAFQVPAGLLARRFGARILLAFAVVWWGIFTVLTALVPPTVSKALLLLIIVRFSLGAGEATMYPATSQFIERWFSPHERARANGIVFAGVGVGSGLTPPLVTFIILHFGWRASFWVSALLGIAGGIVWYLSARDTPEQHPLVREEELALIRRGRDAVPQSAATGKRAIPWRFLLTGKEMIALTVSYFSFGYIAWIFFGWFYIYLAQVRGLNLKSSAIYSMLPFVGMTVGCLLGGVLSDWMSHRYSLRLGRCILPACCFLLTAVLLIFGSQAKDAHTASFILACGAGVLYIPQSVFWAVASNFAGEYAGVSSGVMNMGAQIGGACTASLTPVIAAHLGWHVSFFVAASLAVVGAICWLVINPARTLVSVMPPEEVSA